MSFALAMALFALGLIIADGRRRATAPTLIALGILLGNVIYAAGL